MKRTLIVFITLPLFSWLNAWNPYIQLPMILNTSTK